MKIEMNDKTFLGMVHTILDDVEGMDEEIKAANVLDSLNQALADSRLISAWDMPIDNALKMLITEMMNQAVAVAEAVLATSHIPNQLMTGYTDDYMIRSIARRVNGCTQSVAEMTLDYHKEVNG